MGREREDVRAEVGHIGAIEGLRGIAVLWVVFFHYRALRLGQAGDPWISTVEGIRTLQVVIGNGYLGVDLFFLITGFLLTLPWFRHAAQGRAAPSARAFYRRRVRRIVPAYYAQLAILFAIVVPVVYGADFWLRNLPFTLYNLGTHATFLHYTTPLSSASLGVNGALWTLALEAQYYLLLPLLAPLFVRWPWRTAIALCGIAIAWRWLAAYSLAPVVAWEMKLGAPWSVPESAIRNLLTTQLPGYLAHFAVGVMLGRAWLARRDSPSGTEWPWLAVAACALALLYAGHAGAFSLGDFAWVLVPASLGLATYATLVRAPRASSAVLARGPLAFTGRVSYSMYLYHLPLLVVWNKLAPPLGAASFPIYLALVVALGWLSWRFIELPFMSARNAAWPQSPTSVAPGASEAPPTSRTTTTSGAAPSTTTASSSSS